MTAFRLIKPQLPPLDVVSRYFKLSEDASWFTNFGPCYQALKNKLLEITKAESGLVVSNATVALELVLKSVKKSLPANTRKIYVVTPSYTFAATTTAIRNAGLYPLYVDVDLHDWHASVNILNELINELGDQISCLLLCSTFGTTPSIEKLQGWKKSAETIGVPLFIDCAAGFGGNFDPSKNEISVADAVIYSMHATKPFAVGEGGIILGKKNLTESCLSLANFGFKEDRTFSEFGSNSKISEIMCATALAALETYPSHLKSRREIFSQYYEELKLEERIKFQFGYENCTWQSLFIQIDSSDNLAKIKAGLQTKEIQFRNDWFPPTHMSVPSKHGRESLGNTNQLSSGALTLPIWLGMTQEQIHFISGVVRDSLHH